jgi:hypothetical protein
MTVTVSRIYEGNKVAFNLDEGAWTDDDTRKEGGYFAAELKPGYFVSLGAVAFHATLSGAGVTPVGKLISVTGGKNETGGRIGTVELFGKRIERLEIHTASDAITIGGYVQYSTSGGSYSCGLWQKDGTANDTLALESSSASGSIALGERIYVLMGVTRF